MIFQFDPQQERREYSDLTNLTIGYIINPIVIMETLRSKSDRIQGAKKDQKSTGFSVVGSNLPQSERRVEIVPGVYVGRNFTIPEVSSEDQILTFGAEHLGKNIKNTTQNSPNMSPDAQMARYQAAMGNISGMPSEDQKQTSESPVVPPTIDAAWCFLAQSKSPEWLSLDPPD